MKRSNEWSPEEIATMRRMWLDEKSGGDIGKVLGKTRSAVLGKLHRMGLKKVIREEVPKIKRRALPKKRMEVTPMVIEEVDDKVEEAPQRNISMIELRGNHCRYPTGDIQTSITFCGRASLKGSSYCSEHKKLCMRVTQVKDTTNV